jgi:ketosteroid isomerase-like protein
VSEENVELVRSIYAASERGDFTAAEWAHPDIEYVVADGPDAGSWRGLADMADAARARLSPWEGYRIEADEYRALDDESVLVLIRRSGRGKSSGLDLDNLATEGAQLIQVRDGRVVRYVTWLDRKRAFADLGLADGEGNA